MQKNSASRLPSALVWALALSLFAFAHLRASRSEAHDKNDAVPAGATQR